MPAHLSNEEFDRRLDELAKEHEERRQRYAANRRERYTQKRRERTPGALPGVGRPVMPFNERTVQCGVSIKPRHMAYALTQGQGLSAGIRQCIVRCMDQDAEALQAIANAAAQRDQSALPEHSDFD